MPKRNLLRRSWARFCGVMNYQNYADGAVSQARYFTFCTLSRSPPSICTGCSVPKRRSSMSRSKAVPAARSGLSRRISIFMRRIGLGGAQGSWCFPFWIMNQTHEPNTYFSVLRPIFDQVVIPSTWRDRNGHLWQRIENNKLPNLSIRKGFNPLQSEMDGTDPAKQEGWGRRSHK